MWWAALPLPPLQSTESTDEEGTFALGNLDCHPEKASLPGGGPEVPAEYRVIWSGPERNRRAAEKPHSLHTSSLPCWPALSSFLPKPSFPPLLRSTNPNTH